MANKVVGHDGHAHCPTGSGDGDGTDVDRRLTLQPRSHVMHFSHSMAGLIPVWILAVPFFAALVSWINTPRPTRRTEQPLAQAVRPIVASELYAERL